MCGFFFAKYRKKKESTNISNFLEKECNNYIKNRGPSYQESYRSDSFFAYQSVLSIQSKSIRSSRINALGSQKFFLYNGEIYGLTKDPNLSDTEFLFDKWEKNQLEENLINCDGMFALCTIEQLNNNEISLNVYRDIMGEKHCWYYIDQDVFMISSVPSIIRKFLSYYKTIEVNTDVLEDYLLRRHLISPKKHCIKGIYQVLPGNKLYFDSYSWRLKEVEINNPLTFFDVRKFKYLNKLPQKEFNEEFQEIFKKVISNMEKNSIQNKSSAAIISGGIDSSIVAAELLERDKLRDLFTMVFQDKDPVSKNVPNMVRKILSNDDYLHILDCNLEKYHKSLINSIDILSSPINTHSIPSASIVVESAKELGNKIIYGGEGADEIFLGYDTYSENNESPYNSIQQHFKNKIDLHKRVKEGEIEHFIFSFRSKVKEFLESQIIVSKKDLYIKIESFADTFIQLNNVGLLSTDSVNSNLGIESRTPFTRKELVKFGLSSPSKHLVGFKQNRKISKKPLTSYFENSFGKESLMPKMGFAGFPNETKLFLNNKNNWLVWDYFGWARDEFDNMSIAEAWKIINIEWFIRICVGN